MKAEQLQAEQQHAAEQQLPHAAPAVRFTLLVAAGRDGPRWPTADRAGGGGGVGGYLPPWLL
eukprot:COSAG01_NODE_799_length_13501_cov_15.980749_5_plen_62_part_00